MVTGLGDGRDYRPFQLLLESIVDHGLLRTQRAAGAKRYSVRKIFSRTYFRYSNVERTTRWNITFSRKVPITPKPTSYSTTSRMRVPSRPSAIFVSKVCVCAQRRNGPCF